MMPSLADLERLWLLSALGLPASSTLSEADLQTLLYSGSRLPSAPIQGSGNPNGQVSAPVGTEYVDTNATNGAIKWIKSTGSGNTGWTVSFGDTGWRIILSWTGGVQDGSNQIGVIDTSQFSLTGNGNVKIRRVNNHVQWRFSSGIVKTNSGSHSLAAVASTLTCPFGFVSLGDGNWDGFYLVHYSSTTLASLSYRSGASREIWVTTTGAGFGIGNFNANYTADPTIWPITLPGVAG